MDDRIGFIGLGVMGQPMALNLARAGISLLVWNRTDGRAEPLRAAGAEVAADVDEVFRRTSTVFLMLVDEQVTDEVLGRGTTAFAERVGWHLIVSTGSTSPEYSRGLASDIRAAGGRFVESPVSGSRIPAEAGQLVALVGGDADDVSEIAPLLEPLTKTVIHCGPVGHGLLMKLAVNHYLVISIAGLAEAVHFADGHGLDLDVLSTALNSGQLASDITRAKLPKLAAREFSVQAATADGLANARLVSRSAQARGVASPLLDVSEELYREAVALGNARIDMSSVIDAIAARDSAGHAGS
ncbi:NAD(P)-dependent oxidoreductase [Microbacterium saperdae]|uniref:3-hydroxyisobutyrate dehydrogenase n=1 Tax=Microbacterium saperdae TaxID=69368 RepID=A0A543BIU9_9MICO|nr:NAD(P)-dependent oxidoreductase [Microbacterium saperdae]TQL84718.1 3-hydroxyisobutyrate dehydrogenase [Microbacterium saperdae]GGM64680.1 dehydrogenase [Microbacterium saperdae]